jgi:hypothetical protein
MAGATRMSASADRPHIPVVVYTLHRKHTTLGNTPAVKAGIAHRVWSIEEIIGLLEAREQRAA